MHFFDDVTSTHKVTLDVKLRNCRPVRVLLDTLTHLLISEDVNVLVISNTVELEHLHNVVTETASGHLLRALHEENCIVCGDPLCELLIQFFLIDWRLLCLSLEVTVTLLSIIMIVIVVMTCMESSLSLEHSSSSLKIGKLRSTSQKKRRSLKQTSSL